MQFWQERCPKFTLPVADSLKSSIPRQDELDWGAAGVLHSDISRNRIDHIHAANFSFALQYSMKRPCACAYFNFEMGFKIQEH